MCASTPTTHSPMWYINMGLQFYSLDRRLIIYGQVINNKKGNKMSIKKSEKDKTIISRDVVKIISKREQIPFDMVQAVFNCFYELVEFATSKGYHVCIPSSLGKIKLRKNPIIKKGYERKIGLDISNNLEDNEYYKIVEKSDGTYVQYIKDTEQTYSPYIKISKALVNRIKEESKQWQE